jgi:hypothetical protein
VNDALPSDTRQTVFQVFLFFRFRERKDSPVSDPFVSMTVGKTGETVRITDSHGNHWEPVPKKPRVFWRRYFGALCFTAVALLYYALDADARLQWFFWGAAMSSWLRTLISER